MEKVREKLVEIYQRAKQPHVLLFGASLLYQCLEAKGYGIQQSTFETAVDVVTFVLFGYTIYKSKENNII